MAEPITNVLGTVAIKHCGEYDATMHYEKLNVVTYNGSSYCAKDNTIGNLPTNTTYWNLMAEKGEKGDKGDTPVKGTDYYTEADIDELEGTLSSDVTTEVTSQLSNLTSATPLAASSTAGMTDTTRIYVNTTDGHWYWYNGTTWVDGGTYQATVDSDDVAELKRVQANVVDDIIDYVDDSKNLIKWQIGTISNGQLANANDRIVTPNIVHNKYVQTVKLSDYTTFRFSVNTYDSQGNWIESSGWLYQDYTIVANSYYRIVVVNYAHFEDLRPIGVYNSDAYQAVTVENSNGFSNIISDLQTLRYEQTTPVINQLINYATGISIQGLTKVNNDLWQFSASSSDPTGWRGQILKIDSNNNVITNFHNFGHIPSVNYVKTRDMLVFSNGERSNVTPKIQFYKNLSSHTDTNYLTTDSNYSDIDLSEFGQYGGSVSMGENDKIVYAYVDSTKTLVKFLIGYGSNDFSSEYGTYNYIDDNTFNGTLHKISQTNMTNALSLINDTVQTFTYTPDGRFAFLVGTSRTHLYIYKLINNEFVIDKILDCNILLDNNTIESIEPEGLYVEGKKAYISYTDRTKLIINTTYI